MFPEGRALEFLIVAIVALVVVGPKDLPVLLRRLGQFMAKVRGMAAEFRASFDEMARQSELDELRKEVEALRRGQIVDMAQASAAQAEATRTIEEIHQGLADVGVQLHPPMGYQYAEAPAEAPPAAAPEPPPKPRAKKPAAKTSSAKRASGRKAGGKPRTRKSGPAS